MPSRVETLLKCESFATIASQLGIAEMQDGDHMPACFLRLGGALASMDAGLRERPSGLDLAILIRQCLRHHESQSGFSVPPRITVPQGTNSPTVGEWAMAGIRPRPAQGGISIQAKPWLPGWLPDGAPHGVDAAAASETLVRGGSSVPGDPFMSGIRGHENYQSAGQRSAVRAALCAPPGSTLVVCLPTGEGKSFVFQAVSECGYGAADELPGVTLVVTPTVSLMLDHQRRVEEMGVADNPMAYYSGMPNEQRRGILARIRDGTQGLCFAAPESVCGPLLLPLSNAAAQGYLRAIVVDEAHLVDSWGANFRAEFQLLGGIRSGFLEVSPADYRPRTLLLSATLTNSTLQTLQSIFPGEPDNGGIQLVNSTQLRPEIEFWIAKPTTYENRKQRVIETLAHMPRPAILYVTQVDHAQEWARTLRTLGFKRISVLTGKSSPVERAKVVDDWQEQKIDLVVGTSAFGLGIDNPNVRTIVHACVPETLDRFYQEAGRGGRDGRVAASVIIPASEDGYNWRHDDFRMARSLNGQRLLTVEVAHRRWNAMFSNQEKRNEGNGVFQLYVDVSPGADPEHIDMVGETNTGWNQRALTLMANSGMIELLGSAPWQRAQRYDSAEAQETNSMVDESATQRREIQRVRVIDPGHLDLSSWENQVEPHRKEMMSGYRDNLNRMFQFLEGNECAAEVLAPVYEVGWPPSAPGPSASIPVAKACAGCPFCRRNGIRRVAEKPQIPRVPWPQAPTVSAPASRLLDARNRLLVSYDNNLDRRSIRRWYEGLARLARCGVRNLIAPPSGPIQAGDVQDQLPHLPIFVSTELPPLDYLPPGPVAVILPPGYEIPKLLFRPREPTEAHFIFAHRDSEDPDFPGVMLRDHFEGPQLASLDLFIHRVNR